jgi:uncharacterized protein YkwD
MIRMAMFCALAAVVAAAPAFGEELKKNAVTTVNKPVVEAQSLKDEAKAELRVVRRPHLHEHPTLLRMLGRNNSLRGRMGLRPHRIDPQLTKAAQDHAVYMARTGNFSHYSNGGPQGRASRWGYRGMVRENIAWGQVDVNDAFNSWQNSSGHWASIVSGTTDAGFGYAVGNDGRGYWVALYGNSGY